MSLTFESKLEQDRRVLRQIVQGAEHDVLARALTERIADAMLGTIEHVTMWTERGISRHSTRLVVAA